MALLDKLKKQVAVTKPEPTPAEVASEVACDEVYLEPQVGGPALNQRERDAYLPTLPFTIEVMESGAIHVPLAANRWYTPAEGAALVKLLVDALRRRS